MILDAFRLTGKVALVTGAAQGLGAAMAVGLAEAGADVVVLDRAPLDETVTAIQAVGLRAFALTHDLAGTTPEIAASIVEACNSHFGRLDILVNNAGIIRRSPALEASEDDWRSVIDIDLNSVFFLAQAAARHFVAAGAGGKIINVASMLSYQGGVLVPSYTAAKSAVAGLTRALANEWAPLNINVNAIAPGYFATDVTAAIRNDPVRTAAMLARIPANRWGDPDDLKGAAIYLASEASRYVHGAILPVDGGWLAR
jgi:2-deoxy-D-gluconate 3-dehydrogenase